MGQVRRLLSHDGLKRYFANTSWLLGEKVLRIICSLFIGAWVARYLGPKEFGVLSYAHSLVLLFGAIATLGLDGIVVRELVSNEDKNNKILGTTFILRLIGSFLVLFCILITVLLSDNDSRTNLLIFLISSSTIFQSFLTIDFYFQAKVQSKFVVYANIISLSLSSIIKILLILLNAPLVCFAGVVLFDAFTLALGLVYYYKYQNLKKWIFDKLMAYSLLKDSWPLIFTGIVISIYMRIDQIMIKELLSSEAVGIYSAAIKLSEASYFFPVVVAASLFPAILNARNDDRRKYLNRLQKLYDMMTWSGIGIAIGLTVLGELLVSTLYGKNFNEASQILVLHVWAGVFVFFGCAKSKWTMAENLQLFGFICTLIGAISNIALNYYLIPIYGIKGAAIATLSSQMISVIIIPLVSVKDRVATFMFLKSLFLVRLFER